MVTKTNTFTKNLFLFLVPLIIPLLILGGFAIIITKRYVQEEINVNNLYSLQQTKNDLELIFDELDSIHLYFNANPDIIGNLKRIFDNSENTSNYEDWRFLSATANYINAPANARPYIHSIYVYLDNKNQNLLTSREGYTNLSRYNDKSWYQSYLKHQSGDFNFWSEPRNIREYTFVSKPTKVWTVYRNIYASTGYRKCIGIIVLNIYSDYLQKFFLEPSTGQNRMFFVVNEFNQTIFSNPDGKKFNAAWLTLRPDGQNHSVTVRKGGIPYVVSKIYSKKYRLEYISVIPWRVLNKLPNELLTLTLLLLITSFGLGLILTYYLTKRNYNQVKDIIGIIDAVKKGLPIPEYPSLVKDEYSYITHNILTTFMEQNYLQVQLSERKYRLKFMELLGLQSQINPHFLFNTLETIKWKIIQYTEKPNVASKMLEDLAEILHYSLESPGTMVTLAEEIHNSKNYIQIQSIRYRNKFDIVWEYDEDIKNAQIIRLVFQPLLENCIYHGIKEKNGKSIIKVKIRRRGEMLRCSVIDNGLGILPVKLIEIIENLSADTNIQTHIGLYNTNKRLILTYGESAVIHIRSKFKFGTVIFFEVPYSEAVE